MRYYIKQHTGVKGFITHEDNASAHVAGYPGDVWVTENTVWATRVGAEEITKEEAQTLVDAAISGSVYDDIHPNAGEQIVLIIP